ncbi:hypothetical protein Micbo1qcDRAFT_157816 [Microdochium bolleyi]|uniref:Pentacotripeptide-repeat region of PRORP domain-containing protein n=1 Tax=Microdochium bolleyi TaxID=196109 RepID=A0A136JF09_9PEZI|nr:hypothetical protein Micbo1qcDRAFT_157816 [Microdochium bolleyi]
MHDKDVQVLGKKLITIALSLDESKRANAVYWRVLPQSEGSAFVGWYIRSLHDAGDHKGAVKNFLLGYSKTKPSYQCFQDTAACVVQAVEKMHGIKADQVLKAYAEMTDAADSTLRSNWIMRLLHSHWNRHENFDLSQKLFEEIKKQGVLGRTAHPQGSYRAIIEFALRAGEDEHAKRYYEEAVSLHPQLRVDIPIQGFFALRKAQTGDWTATEEIFTAMRQSAAYETQREKYSRAFVPVLKEYADKHAVEDVRLFLDKYTTKLAVDMDSWMMSLVAKKYGENSDMEGFLSWLEYCLGSGVALDASFCNVVLDNCRTQYQMPYPRLKSLADRMKALHPGSFNAVSRRILRAAASTSCRGAPQKVSSRELAVGKIALAGRSTNPYAVYDAMSHHLAIGQPATALSLYKRALGFGMMHSERCLRLAVMASFQKSRLEAEAFPLIEAAHRAGHPVGSAVTVFLKHELSRVRGTPDTVIRHMQQTVKKFEALRIDFDPEAYTNTAITCIKLGQHDQATLMCNLAMEKAGTSNPCFSRTSFRAWLMIYTQTFNTKGLADLIKALRESDVAAERNTMQQLKSVRRQVQGMQGNDEKRAEMRVILSGAIESVKALRVENEESSATISAETLRIMGAAVLQYEKSKTTEGKQFRTTQEAGRTKNAHPNDVSYPVRLRLTGDTERLGYRVRSPPRKERSKHDGGSRKLSHAPHHDFEESRGDSGDLKAAAAAY